LSLGTAPEQALDLSVLSLGTAPEQALDLSGWVALAYQNSPAISSADASLLSSEASLTSSKSFLWPSLNFSAGASRMWSSMPVAGGGIVDSETNSYSTSLSLSQELLQSGGQNWLYLEASELSLQAARADYKSDVLNVTMDVINAYYGVLEAVELKKAAEAAHERSLNQLERTGALYEIGAATTLQLLQVQVQESTDKLTVTRRDQSLFTSYSSLFNASGMDRTIDHLQINPDAVIEPLPLASVQRIPLDYSDNPGLLGASFRARAAELQSTAAGRAYWPSLRASGGWSWSDNTLDDVDRMFDNDGFNAGVNLSWNVFDGFLRESRIKTARASSLISQASLETLENSVNASVESLSNSLKINIQYYSDSELMLEQAQEQYRLSLMSYEMGALPLLDLLDAQSDLSQAEANLVSARVAALTSEASLMIQLGRMPRVGE
ncbi:MAG: TolC family protein, partial [Candidatus Sabulitectum sp.]|nr:TolC family protein [Candidatus Sabulitectum sp.]